MRLDRHPTLHQASLSTPYASLLPLLLSLLLAAGAGFKGAHLTAPALFRNVLATFQINDWGLFGGGPAAQ